MSTTVAEATVQRRGSSYFYEPAFAEVSFEAMTGEGVAAADSRACVRRGRAESRTSASRETNLPLMTPEEEYSYFRRLNYLKYVLECMDLDGADDVQSSLYQCLPSIDEFGRVERMLDETRERIIIGNMRLVYALARRIVQPEHADFEELVSLGNEALMRACEKFDYRMGFRFSSYAYQAIKCAMFGWLRTERRKRDRLPMVGMEFGELADQGEASQFAEVDSDDDARLITGLLGHLDECDRTIVKARFGLDCPDAEPVPFRTISKAIGLSTTRVVQRFQRAMAKLRQASAVAAVHA